MKLSDQVVGSVQLPAPSQAWLTRVAAEISSVDRREFLREIDSLTAQVRSQGRDLAIRNARALAAEFGLNKSEIFAPKQPVREKITAKFRDPETGNSWSGRGATPSWLRGKDLKQYAIS